MKRVMEKIFIISSAILALLFIIVLLVTAFGGIDTAQFDNSLVRGIFITLAFIFVLLTSLSLMLVFQDNDSVKNIIVMTDNDGTTRVNSQIIKKLCKENMKGIPNVKCKKIDIISTEYGVRLKIGISVVDEDVEPLAIKLRVLLETVYANTLGVKFHAIDFKMVKFQTSYKPSNDAIEAATAELLREKGLDGGKNVEEASADIVADKQIAPIVEKLEKDKADDTVPAVAEDVVAEADEEDAN